MRVKVSYVPSAKQSVFHESSADEAVYGGAKGGGKSCALVMEALAYALEFPKALIYLFRETYDDLEANLIREWKAKVPKEIYSYSEAKHIATLRNGSQVVFRYVSSDADADGYQGRSMDFIGVDELTKLSEYSAQVLLSCLRSPSGFPARFRGTCNPGGIGHAWVKKRYVDATSHGREIVVDEASGNTIQFIPALVYDNDVLMKNDPKYVRRLENLPQAQKKAFLYGDWDIFEGQYFSEWNYEKHTVEPFPIPKHWRKYRAIDYGLDCFACLTIACDDIGNVYVVNELAESNLPISAAAERTYGEVTCTYAPPDLWNRSQETGKSKALIFAEYGLTLTKSNNDREAGWLAIKELLKLDGNKEARLKVFRNCRRLINDLPQLQYDKKRTSDVANEPHDITHVPDALRYFAIAWTYPADKPMEQKKRKLLWALQTDDDNNNGFDYMDF